MVENRNKTKTLFSTVSDAQRIVYRHWMLYRNRISCVCKACVIIWSKINIAIVYQYSTSRSLSCNLVSFGYAGNIDARTYIQSKLIKRTVFALLIIVPTKLLRTENLLAEFARISTHIHNRTDITKSHLWKLM